jgi:very-short-patch-repair endonuclease
MLIDVIARGKRGEKIDGIRRRYVPFPAPSEVVVRDGIPCTGVSRTIVDLAGVVGRRTLRRVVERAAVLGVLDLGAIDAALAGRARRGAPVLRALLLDWRDNAPATLRSELEARLLALIVRSGLPAPLCNHRIEIGRSRIEVDMLWGEERLVVEADGRRYHGDAASFERDRRRDRTLALAGYRVVRVTWMQVEEEPRALIEEIGRLLDIR